MLHGTYNRAINEELRTFGKELNAKGITLSDLLQGMKDMPVRVQDSFAGSLYFATQEERERPASTRTSAYIAILLNFDHPENPTAGPDTDDPIPNNA